MKTSKLAAALLVAGSALMIGTLAVSVNTPHPLTTRKAGSRLTGVDRPTGDEQD